jgi:tRNA pseudouridine38-40 synthase
VERTLRLTVEYDGAGFSGWARQPGRRTVEGTMLDALEALWPGSAASVAVAGRTDAGVHASHQVLSAVVRGGPPPERAGDALRSVLTQDIAVIAATEARTGFHARFSALARRYEYRVLPRRTRAPLRAGHVLQHPAPLDRAALAACAALVLGEHDFAAFRPAATRTGPTRRHVVACAWEERGDELVLAIEADAFLHHMVRMLAGAMLEAGRGARDPSWFGALLDAGRRGGAGPTAPAHGLSLAGIRYAGDSAERDELRCLVARGDELLLAGDALPQGALLPEERIDDAARRIVHEQTGITPGGLPRPGALRVGDGVRVRDVRLEAPAGCAGRFALVAQP